MEKNQVNLLFIFWDIFSCIDGFRFLDIYTLYIYIYTWLKMLVTCDYKSRSAGYHW